MTSFPNSNTNDLWTVQPRGVIIIMLLLALASGINCAIEEITYKSTKCRAHTASLTEFGGLGDGVTSNTGAFVAAVANLSGLARRGGALLYVPPGKWLTGPFNLTSHFTLFLDKDAVLLATQGMNEWPLIEPLPSYGRGRDAPGGRYNSLISGSNLTDVVITGNNGTVDGQGAIWWSKFRGGKLNHTRPYLIEILHSKHILISNITLVDSPSWNIHPVYSSNVIVKGVTILASVTSPNTDGINPDSCSNVKIEDCYIVSGDDCVAVKSGWDQYGIAYGMPTKHVVVRRLTCISPSSAVIALGSEMSGGIRDVRAEDITAINSESAIRIKTAIGRGGYVKDIFAKTFRLHTMKYVFWMAANYGSHADDGWDPKAIPQVKGFSYSDVVAENTSMAAKLDGLDNSTFKGICISDVKIGLSPKPKKVQWNCTNVKGVSGQVSPPPCAALPETELVVSKGCPYPISRLPIDDVPFNDCTLSVALSARKKLSVALSAPKDGPIFVYMIAFSTIYSFLFI